MHPLNDEEREYQSSPSWDEYQSILVERDYERIQRARMDVYDGDAGTCANCRKIIPHEDDVYCLKCEYLMTGVDADSDYGGEYDEC